jgi:hypothetical protein
MKKYEVAYTGWDNKQHQQEDVSFPQSVETLSVSYDGGRFYLSINGVEVYNNLGTGNDFSIDIKLKGESK